MNNLSVKGKDYIGNLNYVKHGRIRQKSLFHGALQAHGHMQSAVGVCSVVVVVVASSP